MNHHRLQCYRRLVTVAQTVPPLLATIPSGHGYLIDQFKRALASAVLNLVEGNGRTSPKERARFFTVAAASLAETEAALELFRAYGLLSPSQCQPLQSECRIIYAMLRKLSKSTLQYPYPAPDRGRPS